MKPHSKAVSLSFTSIFAALACYAVISNSKDSLSSDNRALEGRVAELERLVGDLSERRKVSDVYVLYGRGIDRLDEEAYKKAFWPDAQINYGTEESISPDQHWDTHMMEGFRAGSKSWAHLFTNQVIDITGDVAHVETYLTVMVIFKQTGEGMNFWVGRYVDKLERRKGEWRIAVREYMPHFSMKADVSNHEAIWKDYFKGATATCIQQANGKHDPAYARPLKRRERAVGPTCGL